MTDTINQVREALRECANALANLIDPNTDGFRTSAQNAWAACMSGEAKARAALSLLSQPAPDVPWAEDEVEAIRARHEENREAFQEDALGFIEANEYHEDITLLLARYDTAARTIADQAALLDAARAELAEERAKVAKP